MLKMELKKAFNNQYFVIILIIALVVAIYSALFVIEQYSWIKENDALAKQITEFTTNPDLAMATSFSRWIGQDFLTLASALFFVLFPLFSAFPFAWSLLEEQKSGYVKNVLIRTKKLNYFLSKYLTVFISGAVVVLIPIIVNFFIVSSFIPSIRPDVFYDIYYGIGVGDLGVNIYYNNPFVFVVLSCIICSIFGGLFATISLMLTFFVKNKYAVLLLPFLIFLGINYISGLPQVSSMFGEISPIKYIHGGGVIIASPSVVLTEVAIFFIIPFTITICNGVHNEVY